MNFIYSLAPLWIIGPVVLLGLVTLIAAPNLTDAHDRARELNLAS